MRHHRWASNGMLAMLFLLTLTLTAVTAWGQIPNSITVDNGPWVMPRGEYEQGPDINGHPAWYMVGDDFYIFYSAGAWRLWHTEYGGTEYDFATSTASVPPETGWDRGYELTLHYPPSSSLQIIPTGEAGPEQFLDTTLPQSDAPLMVGEFPLAAIHTVGDIISGSCQILGAMGRPTSSTFVHVYFYAVDRTSETEVRELLSHEMAKFSWDSQEFEFAIDTVGFAPGYYDLLLFFEDESTQYFRIRLIPAEE